jgi:3-oxoacyl-[acyl-carrier protein] reductase
VPRYDRTGLDKDQIVSAIPAGAMGDTDDIGRAAAFLASPDAGYINGEVMFIDGALTSRMRLGG